MLAIFTDLLNRVERYVNLFANMKMDRERDNHAEHREIVEALVARDAARLDRIVDIFFENGSVLRDSIISRLSAGSRGAGTAASKAATATAAAQPQPTARRRSAAVS